MELILSQIKKEGPNTTCLYAVSRDNQWLIPPKVFAVIEAYREANKVKGIITLRAFETSIPEHKDIPAARSLRGSALQAEFSSWLAECFSQQRLGRIELVISRKGKKVTHCFLMEVVTTNNN